MKENDKEEKSEFNAVIAVGVAIALEENDLDKLNKLSEEEKEELLKKINSNISTSDNYKHFRKEVEEWVENFLKEKHVIEIAK